MKTVTKYPWERINPWLVEIPASAREDMLVPARIYVDDVLWERAIGDRTLEQLVNVATMPASRAGPTPCPTPTRATDFQSEESPRSAPRTV